MKNRTSFSFYSSRQLCACYFDLKIAKFNTQRFSIEHVLALTVLYRRVVAFWFQILHSSSCVYYNLRTEIRNTKMSSALFGGATTQTRSRNLVEFKAGKMHLKGTMVQPDKRKGLVYVHQSDDSLMHFCWKDRTNGIVEDVINF